MTARKAKAKNKNGGLASLAGPLRGLNTGVLRLRAAPFAQDDGVIGSAPFAQDDDVIWAAAFAQDDKICAVLLRASLRRLFGKGGKTGLGEDVGIGGVDVGAVVDLVGLDFFVGVYGCGVGSVVFVDQA